MKAHIAILNNFQWMYAKNWHYFYKILKGHFEFSGCAFEKNQNMT